MQKNVKEAALLAAWLTREKNIDRNIAVLISCRKYKVSNSQRTIVSKEATKINKGVPLF